MKLLNLCGTSPQQLQRSIEKTSVLTNTALALFISFSAQIFQGSTCSTLYMQAALKVMPIYFHRNYSRYKEDSKTT